MKLNNMEQRVAKWEVELHVALYSETFKNHVSKFQKKIWKYIVEMTNDEYLNM
jgi:hypothetical protein